MWQKDKKYKTGPYSTINSWFYMLKSTVFTKCNIQYQNNLKYIYHIIKRYDGTLHSLADKSHKPHHPNQHNEQ